MHVNILGRTQISTADGVVHSSELGGVKPRQILEILAVSAGMPVSKDVLADLLWAGHPPRGHVGTLESYVCVLRRSLGLGGGRGAGVITVRQGYVLDPESLQVDLMIFRSLVHRARDARADPFEALSLLERALDMTEGELLADEAYAAWAIEERRRFHRELADVASLAASHAVALGRPDAACAHARTAVARDRLAEEPWRILMRSLAVAGRRSEALRAYFELRDLLTEELGTDPSPTTIEVYLEILRDDPTSCAAISPREEVRVLVGLLRRAVLSIPGVEVPGGDRGWIEAAADLMSTA